MSNDEMKAAQISALSRINFCFRKLKDEPPLQWINNVININSIEKTRQNYMELTLQQKIGFKEELYLYLDKESTTEARVMLIINYLSALLIRGRNNHISIHRNFTDKMQKIEKFEDEKKELLDRLKTARDKLYAHIDLDWQTYARGITFDEFEICIKFLNDLFDYKYELL